MINDNVTFTCTATGIPLPTITWMDQDGNIVGTTSDMVINDTTIQSTLSLSNLQDDDFDNYTCTATNMFGSDDATALLGSECIFSVLIHVAVVVVWYLHRIRCTLFYFLL